ncbi:uncharacterized protein LOC134249646 [Saccostrea cucullata]|uniref:uncharacterized protein LOC134249646 n=1 Tax=Saccostrea cuccullata TaxID=36930 RepID=UPI002ED3ED6E
MLIITLLLSFYLTSPVFGLMKVTTYNLWNIMFNWDVRKYRIARMIREEQSDVIGFQEVRFDAETGRNQVSDLQKLLPEYQWSFISKANDVSRKDNSIHRGWKGEGIGILSRYPIVSANRKVVPYQQGPDTNKRVIIHAKVRTDHSGILDVFVVHFSYVRQQQCENADALLHLLRERSYRYVVILGDMNVYNDFEWPLKLLTSKRRTDFKGCIPQLESFRRKRQTFLDAWTEVHGLEEAGYTFSNMPSPGLESRPDRIIVNSKMEIKAASLTGDGSFYKDKYSSSISFHRLKSLIHHSYLSYMGVTGYACLQDCGPHGSCRCGMCVKGDNSNNCDLPNCQECNQDTYKNIVLFAFVFIFVCFHIFFAVLIIFINGADFRREAVFQILGCNCCLCHPDNFKKHRSSTRVKLFRCCMRWPLFRMPPFYLLLFSILSLAIALYSFNKVFVDSFRTISMVMDEEYYPSDHLMLSAVIAI